MTRYHSDNYIGFLRDTTPKTLTVDHCEAFCIGDDCPLFPGVYDFCQLSAGGSICGAQKLNSGAYDIAVNWAGGLHHAHRGEASGFCYVNDIVLGILELLKVHERVLYVDIDIHHGDGVEEAFYSTPRVMTLSFHKYGGYFPYSGAIDDIGVGPGKYHAVNFPLQDGITDAAYETIFKPVVQAIMDRYKPGAVVLQCGADSLSGDRLGTFNMTLGGHGACAEFIRSFNLPTLVVGGGGYTLRNVARCWCNETAIMLGEKLPDDLPYTEYLEYFTPNFHLQIQPNPCIVDLNSPEHLNTLRARILDNLRYAEGTPQISMHPQKRDDEEEDADIDIEAEENPEIRMSQKQRDMRVARDDEFYDDDDDENDRGVPHRKKARTVIVSELYPYKMDESLNESEHLNDGSENTEKVNEVKSVEDNNEVKNVDESNEVKNDDNEDSNEIKNVNESNESGNKNDGEDSNEVKNDNESKEGDDKKIENSTMVVEKENNVCDANESEQPTISSQITSSESVNEMPSEKTEIAEEKMETEESTAAAKVVEETTEMKDNDDKKMEEEVVESVGEERDSGDMTTEIETAAGSVGSPIEGGLTLALPAVEPGVVVQDSVIPQVVEATTATTAVNNNDEAKTVTAAINNDNETIVEKVGSLQVEKKEEVVPSSEDEKSCKNDNNGTTDVIKESKPEQQQQQQQYESSLKGEETTTTVSNGDDELEPGEILTPPEQD